MSCPVLPPLDAPGTVLVRLADGGLAALRLAAFDEPVWAAEAGAAAPALAAAAGLVDFDVLPETLNPAVGGAVTALGARFDPKLDPCAVTPALDATGGGTGANSCGAEDTAR